MIMNGPPQNRGGLIKENLAKKHITKETV